MRIVSSIEPDGISDCWNTNVRMKSTKTTQIRIVSAYSRRIPLG